MANLFSKPSSHSINIKYNSAGTPKSTGVAFKATPRDKDDALIDLTGYTTGLMNICSANVPVLDNGQSVACTLSGGGASGVDVAITADNAAGIFGQVPSPVTFTLVVDNTTNKLIAATGTFTGTLVPIDSGA